MEYIMILTNSLIEQFEKALENSSSSTLRLALTSLAVGSATYIIFQKIVYPLYFHPLSKYPGPSVGWIPFTGNFVEIQNSEVGSQINALSHLLGFELLKPTA